MKVRTRLGAWARLLARREDTLRWRVTVHPGPDATHPATYTEVVTGPTPDVALLHALAAEAAARPSEHAPAEPAEPTRARADGWKTLRERRIS